MIARVLFVMVVTVPALPAAAQPEPRPFALADVDFTTDCNPNPAFERLLGAFLHRYTDDNAELDAPVYAAVSGDTHHRLMFDDPAPWHGLHLKSIDLYFGIERGPVNYSLVFDDPPERVREVWNGRGWHLPAVNDTRDVEGLEGYASIGVQADEGDFATVTCFRD